MRCIAVVVTFNRPDEARRAVAGLLNQTRPPDRIILVENAETPDLSDAFPPDLVEAVVTGYNAGAAGGFAFGGEIALARGATHVMYVDDDCVLDERAVEVLTSRISALEHTALGAVIVSPEGELVWELHRPDGRLYSTPADLPETLVPTRYLAFHAILVSAEDLRTAGQPRTDLFFGGVDIEFCLRLASNGVSLFYVPGAWGTHHAAYFHRFWLFGWRRVSTGTPGHRYYVMRNRILMWRMYRRDSFAVAVGVWAVKELAAVPFGGQPLRRLWLLARAFKDGLFGDPLRAMPRDIPLHG